MALRLLQRAITATILLSTALAQTPNIIPSDLTAGFNDKEVQASFTSNAANGFVSGTIFDKAAVGSEPTFALGDSNGISPTTRYTLVMLDTTCPTARKLHYVRSNFKFAFAGGTNIETESAPLLAYKAPGAFGEKGDDRQYVFLMYTNPQRREFATMQLPGDGEVFDVKKFQRDNGLNDPVAAVGMVVKLGGTADCEGGESNPVPGGLPTAASSTSSSGLSTAVRSSATSVLTTVPTASVSGSVAPSSSGRVVLSSSISPVSSDEQSATSTSPAETPLQTDEEAAPTSAVPTSAALTDSSSTPTSSAIGQQTANAAAAVLASSGSLVACLYVAAGVLAW